MPVSEALLDQVRAGMRGLTAATAYDKVYNDECVLSFDTPLSPGGLYVSLRTFLGFGAQHVQADSLRTGHSLYVHIHVTRTPKPKPVAAEEAAAAPTKMAIGVEGGFQVDKPQYDEIKETSLVLMPAGERIALPCEELPTLVSQCVSAVLTHTGANAAAKEAAVAWEDEVKPSKYAAELIQLPAHKAISPDPKAWVCEESGMKENLWLNLSDGHIGSGRRQYDGSGGSNGALDHYRKTQVNFPPSGFPLVVKLGTITPHGADVYSYADDENTEVSVSIYAYVNRSIYVSISIFISIFISIYLSIYIYLSIHIYLFIYLSIYLSISIQLYLSIYLSI